MISSGDWRYESIFADRFISSSRFLRRRAEGCVRRNQKNRGYVSFSSGSLFSKSAMPLSVPTKRAEIVSARNSSPRNTVRNIRMLSGATIGITMKNITKKFVKKKVGVPGATPRWPKIKLCRYIKNDAPSIKQRNRERRRCLSREIWANSWAITQHTSSEGQFCKNCFDRKMEWEDVRLSTHARLSDSGWCARAKCIRGTGISSFLASSGMAPPMKISALTSRSWPPSSTVSVSSGIELSSTHISSVLIGKEKNEQCLLQYHILNDFVKRIGKPAAKQRVFCKDFFTQIFPFVTDFSVFLRPVF